MQIAMCECFTQRLPPVAPPTPALQELLHVACAACRLCALRKHPQSSWLGCLTMGEDPFFIYPSYLIALPAVPVAAWLLSTPQEPFVTPAASVLPEWVSRQLTQRFSLRSLRAPSRQLSAAAGRQEAAAGDLSGTSSDRQTDSPKDSLPGSEAEAAAPVSAAQKQQEQQQQQQQQQQGHDVQQASLELQIVVALPSGRLSPGASGSMGSARSLSSQKLQLEAQEAGSELAVVPPLQQAAQPAGAAAPPAQRWPVARERLWLAWSFFRQYYLQAACIVPAAALVVTCITPLRNLLVPDQVGSCSSTLPS